MSEEKKKNPENRKEKKSKKEEQNQMDKELGQTFPASDPPSHSSPGRDREKGGRS